MKKHTTNSLEPSENDVEQPLIPSKKAKFVAIKLCGLKDEDSIQVGDSVPDHWSKKVIKQLLDKKAIKEA